MDDLAKPLPIFLDKTISYMYVHIANTYIAWAGNFAMNGASTYYDQDQPLNITQIEKLFAQVDEIMAGFIAHFSAAPMQDVKGLNGRKNTLKLMPTAYSLMSLPTSFTIKARS